MWPLFNLDEQYAQHPEIKREKVLNLLQWIQSQPHLPILTEHEVLLFFAVSKCDMEATKYLIDINITCRTNYKDFFGCFDVETPRMANIFKTVAACVLPKQTPDGCRVVIGKLLNPDASSFDFTDALKIYFVSQDIILQEIGVVPGFILVIDLTDATFAHLTKVRIGQLKNFLYYIQEAIPACLNSIHFVNIVPFMDRLLALIRLFLKKDLIKRLHVHSNLETFYEHIPREMLPLDLGGKEKHSKVLSENFYNHLREHRLAIMEYNQDRRIGGKLLPRLEKCPVQNVGTKQNFNKMDID